MAVGLIHNSQKLNINTYLVSFNLKDFKLQSIHETPQFFRLFFPFFKFRFSVIRIEEENTQLFTHFGCEDNIDDGARRICDRIVDGKYL